jgi:hypothetical protein
MSRLLQFSSFCMFVILTNMPVLAQSNLNFAPAVAYGSGGDQGRGVTVADVNGDGKPDLLVVNECGSSGSTCTNSTVGVLLGNGDGTFQPAVTYLTGGHGFPLSGGYGTISVAVADVNADGKPDLIVANACGSSGPGTCLTDGTVGVLLGNGDGTFQPVVLYDSDAMQTWTVAVADMNGDGKPDIVVANLCASSNCTNGTVGVLLGNGDGTFQPAVTYGSGGYQSYSVALADVNGDGKRDIVVTNLCPVDNSACDNYSVDGTVGVLLGNGDGTFQPAVTYDSGGQFPFSVAVADVSADGKPDIVVANNCVQCAYGEVSVLLGNGNGAFKAAVAYSSGGYGALSVAVADVNGDGKPDLVVGNECVSLGGCSEGSDVGVLLGNGSFQNAVTYGPDGYYPGSVAAADVNGDGKPDIVVANFCASRGNCTNGTPASVGVLINTEGTTYYTLIDAVKEDVRNRLVSDMMVVTLELAKDAAVKGHEALAELLLKDFIDEVKRAESAKLVTAANARLLIQEANALMVWGRWP